MGDDVLSDKISAPWTVDGETLYGKEFGYTVPLMDLGPYEDNENYEEQTNLIAAAPDLYALVDLVFQSFGGGDIITFSDADMEDFRNALAKARGES